MKSILWNKLTESCGALVFDMPGKLTKMQKVSVQVNLRGLLRLTWVDTFCNCLKPPIHRERMKYSIFTCTAFRRPLRTTIVRGEDRIEV